MKKSYLLEEIDPDLWRKFKAACDIQGLTMKESFQSHIKHVVADFQANPAYTQGWPKNNKKGGKKR